MREPRIDCRAAARFVADGFLRFDALVPDAMNRAVLAELDDGRLAGCRYDDARVAFAEYFAATPAYHAVLRLPAVRALMGGLVGDDPAIDHCAVHVVRAGTTSGQWWHADATIDPRTESFDIQVFYFPHDTPREAGGTMFLPGSHLRRVHEAAIAGHQNFRGQVQTVCPAGTVIVAHHGLWHGARPNRTASTRYMVKLRLNPRVPQRGLFPLDDLAHDDVRGALGAHHGWEGVEYRLEILQRLRLFRALTGTDYDQDLWLSRLEGRVEPSLQAAHAG